MTNSLFVYGTLRLGQPNAHVMERIGGEWLKGTVLGELEQRGWGAHLEVLAFDYLNMGK